MTPESMRANPLDDGVGQQYFGISQRDEGVRTARPTSPRQRSRLRQREAQLWVSVLAGLSAGVQISAAASTFAIRGALVRSAAPMLLLLAVNRGTFGD
jgi:hypothetical protein